MNSHVPQFLVGIAVACVLFLPGSGGAQDSGAPAPKEGRPHDEARSEAWDSLSPEQREQLRQALRDVWTDPAVVAARAEVNQASEAYKAAVKAAVSRADPSIADALSKIQTAHSGIAQESIAGRPPMPMGMGPKRGFEEEFKPPGFLESLPPQDRERFRKAEAAAMKSESVKAAREELDGIKREDEALRSKRLEAFRKLRKAVIDEMIRIDPSIDDMQKRLPNGERHGQPPLRHMDNGPKPESPKAKIKPKDEERKAAE